MAKWLLVERRVAELEARGKGEAGQKKAWQERVAKINALLDGSAGESYLADLVTERDRLKGLNEGLAGRVAKQSAP
jgi:hypothetical protein